MGPGDGRPPAQGHCRPGRVIPGRRSDDEWVNFWPRSEIEPPTAFTNRVEKYVAISTPLTGQWSNNTTVIDRELADFVLDLKNRSGADIGIHAGISITHVLLKQIAAPGHIVSGEY